MINIAALATAEKIAVVKIHNRNKEYSYFMGDSKYKVGDEVIVPVREGGPLHATVMKVTSARRYKSKAVRTIISGA